MTIQRVEGLATVPKTSAENTTYTGQNGEIVNVIDGGGQATGEIRVHDGVSAGGVQVGGVLQTKSTLYLTPTSFSIGTSRSWVSQLECAVTAKKANARFLVHARIFCEVNSPWDSVSGIAYTLNSGTVVYPNIPTDADIRNVGLSIPTITHHDNNDTTPEFIHMTTMVESANSENDNFVFTIYLQADSTKTFYLNRTVVDSNQVNYERGSSEIIIQELA